MPKVAGHSGDSSALSSFDDFEISSDFDNVEIERYGNFTKGLEESMDLAYGLESANREGLFSGLQYISQNVNPHQIYGIAINSADVIMSGGGSAFNQNCFYCAKATEMNLNLISRDRPNTFYMAQSTSKGALPDDVGVRQFQSDGSFLSEQLLAELPEGNKGIISVKVKGRDFNHFMNLVNLNEESRYIIDGQFGHVYDLNSQADSQAFNTKYGNVGDPYLVYDTGSFAGESFIHPNHYNEIESVEVPLGDLSKFVEPAYIV